MDENSPSIKFFDVMKVLLTFEGQFDHVLELLRGEIARNIISDMSVMGSGKTYTGLCVIMYLILEKGISTILISSTEIVFSAWKNAINTMAQTYDNYLEGLSEEEEYEFDTYFVKKGKKKEETELKFSDLIHNIRSSLTDLKNDGISSRFFSVGTHEVTLIHTSHKSLIKLGLGYEPSEKEIAHVKEISSKYKYNPKDAFPIEMLQKINVDHFRYGPKYTSSNYYFMNDILGEPGKSLFVQDEFQSMATASKQSFYAMSLVNLVVDVGSYVLNLSGTPSPKPKYTTYMYATNAIYYPSHGFSGQNRKTTKTGNTRMVDKFDREGLLKLWEIIESYYADEDIRETFNLKELEDPYSIRRGILRFADKNLDVTEENIMRLRFKYLTYIDPIISSILQSKDIDFALKRRIHTYYFNPIYLSKKLKEASSGLGSGSSLYRKGDGSHKGNITITQAGYETNIIFYTIIKTIELLQNNKNRVIIFLSYVNNMNFVKYMLVYLGKFYGLLIDLNDIDTLFSNKTGEFSSTEKTSFISRSKLAQSKVMIVSYGSGSEGISLNEDINPITGTEDHDTHVIIHGTFSSQYQQAISRAIRAGIVNVVDVHFMVNSLEIVRNMMLSYYNTVAMYRYKNSQPMYGLFRREIHKKREIIEEDLADLEVDIALDRIKLIHNREDNITGQYFVPHGVTVDPKTGEYVLTSDESDFEEIEIDEYRPILDVSEQSLEYVEKIKRKVEEGTTIPLKMINNLALKYVYMMIDLENYKDVEAVSRAENIINSMEWAFVELFNYQNGIGIEHPEIPEEDKEAKRIVVVDKPKRGKGKGRGKGKR